MPVKMFVFSGGVVVSQTNQECLLFFYFLSSNFYFPGFSHIAWN